MREKLIKIFEHSWKHLNKMEKYLREKGRIVGLIRDNGEIVNFNLDCEICGLRYGDRDIVVQEHCEEEGFIEGVYCDECCYCMCEQEFVGEDKSIYVLKKDVNIQKCKLVEDDL